MRKLILLIFLCSIELCAQNVTDKWYFGQYAALDFTGGTATVLNDNPMYAFEGSSSIADSSGNLLFYTDGITVWNNLHQPMPNGNFLAGGISSQSALIVPLPGSITQYYVFTLDAVLGIKGLQYSIVEMTADSGRGDVVSKNNFIRGNLTEKLTAVANNAEDAYWIAVHDMGTDTFFVYKLSQTGLDTIPVISEAGMTHHSFPVQNAYGQMKFSPCGNMLAVAAGYKDTVEVFNFDNATGIITYYGMVPFLDHVFGVEFSPNGRKLYVSTYEAVSLYQVDLDASLTTTALSIEDDIYSLQLAIDGKVYVTKSLSPWLGVITDPDVAGWQCNYIDTGINLDPLILGHTGTIGMPNFVQSFFSTASCISTGIENAEKEAISIYPNPFTDEVTVSVEAPSLIEIFDLNARMVMSEWIEIKEYRMGLQLDSGIYFLRITDSEKSRLVRIVKI